MAPSSVFQHILLQLQDGSHTPAKRGADGPRPSHRPALHGRRAQRQNLGWLQARAARVEAHARRVAAHLKHHSRRRAATHGRRRPVWCVELGRAFASLSAAARFVGRAPENVYQAVRFGTRCGPYHWEPFDPARHAPPGPGRPVLPRAEVPFPVEHSPAPTPGRVSHGERPLATVQPAAGPEPTG